MATHKAPGTARPGYRGCGDGSDGIPPIRFRLRVRYRKDGRLAYLGHLEVLRTIDRSVRRSGLPYAVGNGFVRRMKVQFSQALPVGAASTCEYYDLMLTERVDALEAFEALRRSTPSALAPVEVRYVEGRVEALEAWLNRSHWDVRLGSRGPLTASSVNQALVVLRERGYIDFMRGDKPRHLNLGSTLVGWTLEDLPSDDTTHHVRLALDTRSSNRGALRPAVLLEAAFKEAALTGVPLDSLSVTRMSQMHEAEDGSLVAAL